ncbi:MAG: RNA polymerase sigma factor [Flavobacteriia bacterium]|nr:RNA polymerase sigma factor [Flavobacteriia bacterium]
MRIVKTGFVDYSDEDLMLAIQQGEKLAFNELYTRYSDKLYGYILKMLWYNEVRAQDLLQDLFAKIITQPGLFDTERTFKTWVYTIASNLCKNEFKRNEVRKGTVNGVEQFYSLSSDANVEKEVHERQFRDALTEALMKLDTKHRQVFVLKHMDGLSIKEIAEITEANEGTVKSRLFYAIKKLADTLHMFEYA